MLGPRKFPHQALRLVNQDRQMCAANPGFFLAIGQFKQRDLIASLRTISTEGLAFMRHDFTSTKMDWARSVSMASSVWPAWMMVTGECWMTWTAWPGESP